MFLSQLGSPHSLSRFDTFLETDSSRGQQVEDGKKVPKISFPVEPFFGVIGSVSSLSGRGILSI